MQNTININSINYTKEQIKILIEQLENIGYVINDKEIPGYKSGFTDTQLDNIKNSNLDKLIEQFEIETSLNSEDIHCLGNFYPGIGNVIIYYNNKLIDYDRAKLILKFYIDNYK